MGAQSRVVNRRVVLLVVAAAAVLLAAGCSTAGHASPAARPAASSSPTAAVVVGPYDAYLAAVHSAGLSPDVQRFEAGSVAQRTCDNSVDDMRGLIDGVRSVFPSDAAMRGFVTDRAAFIDAFCPAARVRFDAATVSELGYALPTHQ